MSSKLRPSLFDAGVAALLTVVAALAGLSGPWLLVALGVALGFAVSSINRWPSVARSVAS